MNTVTFTNCKDELIRIPGLVQDGVVLIAYEKESQFIRYVSENIHSIFGHNPNDLIGTQVRDLLNPLTVDNITQHFLHSNLYFLDHFAQSNASLMPLIAHQTDKLVIVEIDQNRSLSTDSDTLLNGYNTILSKLSDVSQPEVMIDLFAGHLKLLTGFDRVMVYRFDEEWNGEVISECIEDHLEPFLGLHYPHTDIPVQARELYLKNIIRTISDVNYSPLRILPESGPTSEQPLDLSMAVFRSVSPMHIQYLKNMGVGATMTTSIIINGKLWGLMACHHYSKKHIDLDLRSSIELLTKSFNYFFQIKINEYENKLIDEKNRIGKTLYQSLVQEWDLLEGLIKDEGKLLLELMNSDGVMVRSGIKSYQFGNSLDNDRVIKLLKIINNSDDNIWFTKSISQSFPNYNWSNEIASVFVLGLDNTPGKNYPNDCVLWFRLKKSMTVKWAGNPYLNKEGAEHELSPRKSFEIWQENMDEVGPMWDNVNIESAKLLKSYITDLMYMDRQKLSEQVHLKTLEIQLALEEAKNAKMLALSSSRLRSQFLANISHEVRTPLNSIMGLSQMIKEEAGSDANINEWSGLVVQSCNRLLETMSSILVASEKNGSNEDVHVDLVVIEDFLMEIINTQLPLIENSNLYLKHNLGKNLNCATDQQKLRQVIMNILNNALKFTEKGGITITAKKQSEKGVEHIVININDTGIGISEDFAKTIFEPFSEEKSSLQHKYDGTGLGLFISKKYIDLMGGFIEIESSKGVGTKFQIKLPVLLNREIDESIDIR